MSVRAIALFVSLLMVLGSCAPGAAPAAPGKLVIAVQPTATPETLSADAKELRQHLSKRLGREVEIVFPTTYAGVVEALRFGHAHAAFMSAWPAQLAVKHAGAEVALAEVREVVIGTEKQEQPYYFSYWVVRKDSPAAKLADLKGKKAALTSALSTSGYVAPVARMVELGLITSAPGKEADPKQFFSEVLLPGGYQQAWEALKAGQVDVSVIAGDVSEKLYREVLDATKVVEQQGPVPSHAVLFAKDLPAADRDKLKAALLELGDPALRPLMRKFISGIFVGFRATSAQEHLGPLAKYLDLTQLAFVERIR
ncbi:MAG TPA: phosphate/phosphite/phosphonate ABC transporter substrate-binding protein [Candidatus Limnocylindria bacterium]|nr:phosphate/phosphite/phosphonate ABC transporter substrate-binding protein [Candidatus Limnocylindria bacterium]